MKRRRESERRTEMKTCEIMKTEGAIESRPSIFGKRDGPHESNSDCEPDSLVSFSLFILVSRCVDASFCLSLLKWIARMKYQTQKQGSQNHQPSGRLSFDLLLSGKSQSEESFWKESNEKTGRRRSSKN